MTRSRTLWMYLYECSWRNRQIATFVTANIDNAAPRVIISSRQWVSAFDRLISSILSNRAIEQSILSNKKTFKQYFKWRFCIVHRMFCIHARITYILCRLISRKRVWYRWSTDPTPNVLFNTCYSIPAIQYLRKTANDTGALAVLSSNIEREQFWS